MSEEALYERYKSALRNGHVAAVRGRHEAAMEAYAEAATLAPDRPLPHSSLGRVLLRLDRVDEALTAFAAALRLAPHDEPGLAGRADALIIAGRPAEAAGVLDLLADTQETAGRLPDACDTARRALELAESRARRRHLEAIVAELQGWPADRGAADQLERAVKALEALAPPAPATAPSRTPVKMGTGDAKASATAVPTDEPTNEPIEAVEGAEPSAAPVSTAAETAAANAEGASEVELAAATAIAIAEPALAAEVAEPAPDAGALTLAVDAAVATGDAAVVHSTVLDAVAQLRRAGLLDAAIDACQLGLTVAPADPDLHLALAELDLDHGWVTAAADKLLILDRYVVLTGDGPARKRLHELVAERIPDDARLSALRA